MLFSSCNLSCGLKAHHFGGFVILNFHTRLLCRGVVDHVAHGQANLNGRSIRKKNTYHEPKFIPGATVKRPGETLKLSNTHLKQTKTQLKVETAPFSITKKNHASLWLRGWRSLDRGAVIWCSPEVTPKRRLKTMAKALRKSPSSCTAPESSQAENTQQKQKPKIFGSFLDFESERKSQSKSIITFYI